MRQNRQSIDNIFNKMGCFLKCECLELPKVRAVMKRRIKEIAALYAS